MNKAPTAKIEGGFDALVAGASIDGLAAAAALAKAGMHTVLLDTPFAERPGAGRRELVNASFGYAGDPFSVRISPQMIAELDLYRHGLNYAQRRLSTVYCLSGDDFFELPAEADLALERIEASFPNDVDAYARLLDVVREAMAWLDRDGASRSDAPLPLAMTMAADDALRDITAAPLRELFYAEAALGAAVRPYEAFSWGAMALRLSGETAGLGGAVGYVRDGLAGLANALRRAGQSAGVEFRSVGAVKAVLVEWDRIAGLELESGDPLRAPIVVSAHGAATTFERWIGAKRLDVEFSSIVGDREENITSVRIAAATGAPPSATPVATDLARRFVVTASDLDLQRAWRAASAGEHGDRPLCELCFPSAFDPSLAADGVMVNALVHPAPKGDPEDPEWLGGVRKSFTTVLGSLDPALVKRVEHFEVSGLERAWPPVAAAAARAQSLTRDAGVAGFYFCGREASLGRYAGGHAGRAAARAALADVKNGRVER